MIGSSGEVVRRAEPAAVAAGDFRSSAERRGPLPQAVLRAHVCAIARSWIGTPYHHMGRVKGAGVDCAMFPLEVYREAGLIKNVDVPYYPQDWMLHRSEEIYLGIVERYATELKAPPATAGGSVLPGDFVLYRFGRCFAHGAIVIDWPTVIHAVNVKGVILSDGEREGFLTGRQKRFFSLWT